MNKKEILKQMDEHLNSNNGIDFLTLFENHHADLCDEYADYLKELKKRFTLKEQAGHFLYVHRMNQSVLNDGQHRFEMQDDISDFFLKTRLKHKELKNKH